MAAYATVDEVRQLVGKTQLNADQTALITRQITAASRRIDQETGQWFDTRAEQFKTEAPDANVSRLFLPAKLISITSVVSDGQALVSGIDEEFLEYEFWLERTGQFWTRLRQRIVVTGVFGRAVVPDDIRQACADLAASWSGLRNRSYVDGDGVGQSVLTTTIPAYVKEVLDTYTIQHFSDQTFTGLSV